MMMPSNTSNASSYEPELKSVGTDVLFDSLLALGYDLDRFEKGKKQDVLAPANP